MKSLLERTRLLTRLLQSQVSSQVRFVDIAAALNQGLGGRVGIVSRKGKLLAVSPEFSAVGGPITLSEKSNHLLLSQAETAVLNHTELQGEAEGKPVSVSFETLSIFPVFGGGERLGTLLIDVNLDDKGMVLAEFATTVVGMEILHAHQGEDQEINRKGAAAKMAFNTLSYSETEAMVHVFRELGGPEGLLVASKIADRVGVTRSVIVNALRKLESAGVLTSRSLGMKGTFIKVLNPHFLEEIGRTAS